MGLGVSGGAPVQNCRDAGASCCSGSNLLPIAEQFLHLQDDVGDKQRGRRAHPDQQFPVHACEPVDYAHFEEDQRAGAKAAGHPLAVLLDFSIENEPQGDGGGAHPQAALDERFDGERAVASDALFEPLDVRPHRGRNKCAGDVQAADDAVQLHVALPEAIGELHRPEEQRAGAGQSVRQQPPLERRDVPPFRVGRIDEEAFVVDQHVGEHQGDKPEEQILRAQPRAAFERRCRG